MQYQYRKLEFGRSYKFSRCMNCRDLGNCLNKIIHVIRTMLLQQETET